MSSPYPLSVTRLSSPSPTRVTYRISLVSDYHCPPEPPFNRTNISFLSSIAHQEELVSVSFLELDQACPPPEVSNLAPLYTPLVPADAPRGSLPPSLPLYFSYIFVTILTVIVATVVICLALNKSSSHGNTGFSAHLPPTSSGATPTPPTLNTAFSPVATPMQQQTSHMSGYPSRTHTPATPFHPVTQHTPAVATPTGIPRGAAPPASGTHRRPGTGFSSSPGQHGLFSQ